MLWKRFNRSIFIKLEWSRSLINYLTNYLSKQRINFLGATYSYKDMNISLQLIFTTHSPFLLSDLKRSSIIALELRGGKTMIKKDIYAFAQNIQRVMKNQFFIKDSYGEFANNKIQAIYYKVNVFVMN